MLKYPYILNQIILASTLCNIPTKTTMQATYYFPVGIIFMGYHSGVYYILQQVSM